MDSVLSEVAKAFKCSGDPQKLEGGQGRSYRVGELVLKPVDDIIRLFVPSGKIKWKGK